MMRNCATATISMLNWTQHWPDSERSSHLQLFIIIISDCGANHSCSTGCLMCIPDKFHILRHILPVKNVCLWNATQLSLMKQLCPVKTNMHLQPCWENPLKKMKRKKIYFWKSWHFLDFLVLNCPRETYEPNKISSMLFIRLQHHIRGKYSGCFLLPLIHILLKDSPWQSWYLGKLWTHD